jgi:hypothetical protein
LYLAGVFLASVMAANFGNAQAVALNDLPEDPALQQAPATTTAPSQQTSPQNSQQPATAPTAQTQNSTPQQSTDPNAKDPNAKDPAASKDPQAPKPETSADQLRAEEKQRILGLMATFNTTSNRDALPLTTAQKFQLFFKSATDPWTIGLTAFTAGIGQAEDSPPEWKGGMEGYSKRLLAGYTDTFDGNLWGNAILTSWWHEDPRYYRMGSGNKMKRFFWAAGSSFWCKRDNGTWGPNYANVVGNLIGGAIANAYYPPSQRGLDPTLEHSASVTYYGILGAEVIEFWPDISRHYQRKHQEKLARKAAQQDAQQPASPTKPD